MLVVMFPLDTIGSMCTLFVVMCPLDTIGRLDSYVCCYVSSRNSW